MADAENTQEQKRLIKQLQDENPKVRASTVGALVSTGETVSGLIQQVVVNPDQFQIQEGRFTEPVAVTLPELEVPSIMLSAETVNRVLSAAGDKSHYWNLI